MKYENYVNEQNAVYAQFRSATKTLDELMPDPCIASPSAGYIISFRHNEGIMQSFAEFTRALSHVVPSLRYDAKNGHTTLTVYRKRMQSLFQPDLAILDALCRIVAQIDREMWQQVRVDFRDWTFNRESVIVTGQPNEAFWEVGEEVNALGKSEGLNLRRPWGAHMTAARFTTRQDSPIVQALRQHLEDAPLLGTSIPTKIDVGYYTSSTAGFLLHSVKTFE